VDALEANDCFVRVFMQPILEFCVERSMTKEKIALVFGGGGARGAYQVGAIKALYERGISVDFLVGTSIGAVNASYLAIHGLSADSIQGLEQAWRCASTSSLLSGDVRWLALRALLGKPDHSCREKMERIFRSYGVDPELHFSDLHQPGLYLVSTDLGKCRLEVYGDEPDEHVLEGMLASAAIPPYVLPMHRGERVLIDGGAISNVPIETAMRLGATRILALDVSDPRSFAGEAGGIRRRFSQLMTAIEQRQVELEIELAKARGVEVFHICLWNGNPVPIWDFSKSEQLMQAGYEMTRIYLDQNWKPSPKTGGFERLFGWMFDTHGMREDIGTARSQ
jgi:NTE family protein